MVGGVQSYPPETLGGHKQNLVYTKTKRKEQWPPQETGTDLPMSVWESPTEAWVSGGLARGQRLWQQQSWEAQCVAWVLLKEVAISPIIELLGRQVTNWKTIIPKKFSHCYENSRPHNRLPKGTENLQGTWLGRSADLIIEPPQDWGNRDSWRTHTKSCAHQDPGERSCDPTRDWARLACACLGVSGGGMGWQQPVTGSGTLTTTVLGGPACWHKSFFWRRWPLPPPRFGLRPDCRREHSPTHQQKIGLKTYWACPCPPEQDPVFPRASPFHQESCTSLLSSSIRGQTEWNHSHRKLTKLWTHGPQSCLTQWNYEPRHVGPPRTDESWWRVLTKRDPQEKGMANHISILALRTTWTVWKGKKI